MEFAVTFDYLCPFARNANEAVLSGLERGEDWDVTFRPFSLAQAHTEEGETAVWERPEGASGVRALLWGLATRDEFPEVFPLVHRSLFAARHDHGLDIGDESVLREAVAAAGGNPDAVAEVVASGRPGKVLASEHSEAVERWAVFGVPTFIVGEEAVFVRFMERDRVEDLRRVLELLTWTNLNEFKRTRVPR